MSGRTKVLANHRALLAPTAAALALLAAAGCSGDATPKSTATGTATCAEAPTPAPALTGALAAFDLTGVATPIGVTTEDGFLVLTARAEGSVQDLTTEFLAVVEEAGFDVAGSDDEGFEAEVFFAAGKVAAGQVILTSSSCPGAVDVRITLLDDPAVLPSD